MIAFSTRSQVDTSKICFPRKVVIGIQKDLIRLDYCDSTSHIKDTIIFNRNLKIALKDSIHKVDTIKMSLYKSNENAYQSKLKIKDDEIKIYVKEVRRQKVLKWFERGIFGAVIILLVKFFVIK